MAPDSACARAVPGTRGRGAQGHRGLTAQGDGDLAVGSDTASGIPQFSRALARLARSSRLRPVAHFTPGLPDVFHDQPGWVQVRSEGLDAPLHLRSVQWAHWNGDVRLDEAQKLTRYAAPDVAAVIGGDFNSLWPDCPGHEPEFEPDWEALPPHKRHHKTLPPGLRPDGRLVSDRRALTVLAGAGFTSAGCAARDVTVTVNAGIDNGQGGRIDHLVLSPLLAVALVPGTYRVCVSDAGNRASDHRLVTARIDLDLFTPAPSAGPHGTRKAAP